MLQDITHRGVDDERLCRGVQRSGLVSVRPDFGPHSVLGGGWRGHHLDDDAAVRRSQVIDLVLPLSLLETGQSNALADDT